MLKVLIGNIRGREEPSSPVLARRTDRFASNPEITYNDIGKLFISCGLFEGKWASDCWERRPVIFRRDTDTMHRACVPVCPTTPPCECINDPSSQTMKAWEAM